MTILTITPDTWYLAGISVAVVFAILVALVLVLVVFSVIAKSAEHHHEEKPLPAGSHVDAAQDDELAVVATAIYLYLNSAQDEESGVITVRNNPNPGWHAVLNPRF